MPRTFLILIAIIACCLTPSVRPAWAEDEPAQIIRFGFCKSLFPNISKSDADAAIKVWGDHAFQSGSVNYITVPVQFETAEEIRQALHDGKLETVVIRGNDVLTILDEVHKDPLILNVTNGSVYEEYRLLVRENSGIKDLAGLRGKSLAMSENISLNMAFIWLDTLALKQEGTGIEELFGKVVLFPKDSRAVLSVFFGAQDACLVSQGVYETMMELNPQIGKQLRVVMLSPKFVNMVIAYQRDYPLERLDESLDFVMHFHQDAETKQMMTVFGIDQLLVGGLDELDSIQEWVTRHDELLESKSSVNGGGEQ
ncbi:MAG: PhnD/SsuA/transferrin family substrate-binding protein [Pontiellaceae bacterium]|nr:PhnD/SsuA/transferrin family substrate-binding protein [Pontiellaceae bacterium]MBN2786636.1 PhnD/SsuA/transferrin family substrate-binding protein [Pontiellaceae bacterium]